MPTDKKNLTNKRVSRTTPEAPSAARRGRPRKDSGLPVEVAPELTLEIPAPSAPVAKRPARTNATTAPPSKPAKQKQARSSKAVDGLSADDDMPVPIFRAVLPKGEPAKAKPEIEAKTKKNGLFSAPPKESVEAKSEQSPTSRRRKSDPKKPVAPVSHTYSADDEDVPSFSFQPVTKRAPDKGAKTRPSASTPAPRINQEAASSKPEIAEKKTRTVVRVPGDAPQVVIRNGNPTLVRDGVVYPPIFFFGSARDEARLDTVLEEIKLAAEAGVHVVSHFLEFEVSMATVNEATSFAAYLLRKTLDVNPSAQVIFRVVFTAPTGWESTYRNAKFFLEDGGLGEPSVCDDEFWSEAERCLIKFISQIRLLDGADSILGIHLERGEWFFADGWGYDVSPAAQKGFQEWARARYRNDNVALAASWFDGQASFDTISVPKYTGEAGFGEEFVRTGRKARPWVDYHLFLSDATYDRISLLAHAAKRASDGYFLVGVSYGYTFEWSHPANGHLALGKLLRNPEVDFIAGPPSYRNREPGGTSPFPCPIDSFALNGKLYISEEDFKTPISGRHEPDDFNPVMKTPQALDSVHWRGLGAALAHRGGVCWMDLWGNGWLNSHGIWDRAKSVRRSLIEAMATPPTDPDVAVFIDERSLAYLVDERAFELLIQNVRESVLRSGLSAGFYLLSDLAHRERFPDAKLYVFTNAWDIRPELRQAIKSRLQRDGKVLFWLYASGLFESGRDALERVREVTGIAIKRQPFDSRSGTTLVHRKHPLAEALPEALLAKGGTLEPSYFAVPEDGLVLAEYTNTGLPSYVVRRFQEESTNWTSVFLGEPIVTPSLFRALGQLAGCHIWSYQEDTIHAQAPFLTVHCRGAGMRTIALPDRFVAYSVQGREYLPSEGTQIRFSATDGSTHTFLVGLKSDVEAILNHPEDTLLVMEEQVERPENTLQMDEIMFDVQIMKLDDWVPAGDELRDDLLFRAAQLEELEQFDSNDASSGNRITNSSGTGRQRGRRRRDRDQQPTRSKRTSSKDFDIAEMNVVFRKRE